MYSAIQITRKKKLFHKILKRKNRLLFLTQRIALKYFRLRYHFALSRSVGFQVKLISSTPIMHNMRVDKFAFCCPHKGFLNSTLILLCKKKTKVEEKNGIFVMHAKKWKLQIKQFAFYCSLVHHLSENCECFLSYDSQCLKKCRVTTVCYTHRHRWILALWCIV